MLSVPSRRLYIELLDGTVHEVRPLSVRKNEEFRQYLIELNSEVNDEQYKDISFAQGYVKFPKFAYIVDNLLRLIGLTSEQIDLETLYKMLFPHYVEDGSYNRQGTLTACLFGPLKETGGGHLSKEVVDQYSKLIGDLWASMSSFTEVVTMLNSLDSDTLANAIKARNEVLMPAEDKNKRDSLAKAKEKFEELKANGSLFVVGDEISDTSNLFGN
jgi:hypothetical protein